MGFDVYCAGNNDKGYIDKSKSYYEFHGDKFYFGHNNYQNFLSPLEKYNDVQIIHFSNTGFALLHDILTVYIDETDIKKILMSCYPRNSYIDILSTGPIYYSIPQELKDCFKNSGIDYYRFLRDRPPFFLWGNCVNFEDINNYRHDACDNAAHDHDKNDWDIHILDVPLREADVK